jgi:hypothetical protein
MKASGVEMYRVDFSDMTVTKITPPSRPERLANVERLLAETKPAQENRFDWPLGANEKRKRVEQALAEVRAMIDEGQA